MLQLSQVPSALRLALQPFATFQRFNALTPFWMSKIRPEKIIIRRCRALSCRIRPIPRFALRIQTPPFSRECVQFAPLLAAFHSAIRNLHSAIECPALSQKKSNVGQRGTRRDNAGRAGHALALWPANSPVAAVCASVPRHRGLGGRQSGASPRLRGEIPVPRSKIANLKSKLSSSFFWCSTLLGACANGRLLPDRRPNPPPILSICQENTPASSPTGARDDSPGQRPGKNDPNYFLPLPSDGRGAR
jgi:hypothetical protein